MLRVFCILSQLFRALYLPELGVLYTVCHYVMGDWSLHILGECCREDRFQAYDIMSVASQLAQIQSFSSALMRSKHHSLLEYAHEAEILPVPIL